MTILLQGAGLQTTTTAPAGDPIGDGLRAKTTAYYKLDETGNPWKDSKGNNNLVDGVSLGSDPVLSAQGVVNGAASFAIALSGNGTALYHVSNSDFTTGDVSFAVVCWLWLDAKNPVGYTIV
jgi:hypothetical protein